MAIGDLANERVILLGEMHCLDLGQGVSILPEMTRATDRTGKLVYRPLADDGLRRTVAVVCHRHYYRSPLAEAFLTGLRQWAARKDARDAGS